MPSAAPVWDEEARTLPTWYAAAAQHFGRREVAREIGPQGRRSSSWATLEERVRHLAYALMRCGLTPGERVAIIGPPALDWLVADLATLGVGGVTVGVNADLLPEEQLRIMADAGPRLAVVADEVCAQRVAEGARDNLPTLERILVMAPTGELGSLSLELPGGVEVVAVARAVEPSRADGRDGRRALAARWGAVAPDDLAALVYTSGTTGPPKGVELTHRNLHHAARVLAEVSPLSTTDVAAVCRPLSDILQRVIVYAASMCGAVNVFARSWAALVDDLAEVRPTVLSGGPVVYAALRDRLLDELTGRDGVSDRLLAWAMDLAHRKVALDRAESPVPASLYLPYQLADKLVLRRVRARLGGRIRFLGASSARVPGAVRDFFDACGIRLLDGYGLAETAGIVTLNRPDAYRYGTLGPPIRGCEARIAPDGEVLVRGATVFRGYWNAPHATRAAFTADGWFRTGDIGSIGPSGHLAIRGRKDEVVVTEAGHLVVPQPIEKALRQHPLVGQACVVSGRRRGLAALLTLDPRQVKAWTRAHGIKTDDVGELATDKTVLDALHAHVGRVNGATASLETITGFAVLPEAFSVSDGTATPSGKMRRSAIAARHAELLIELG